MSELNVPATVSALSCLFVGAAVWSRRGIYEALGVVVLATFLIPAWVQSNVAGLPWNVRTIVTVAGLLAFAIRDVRSIISPITAVDLAIAALVVIHFFADLAAGGQAIPTGFRAYGEWAIPYVAGRYAMRGDRRRLAWWACAVLAMLSIGGIIESVTGTNLWEHAFGIRPLDDTPRDLQRFGFKRAYGTCMHSIFFGMLLFTLLPWPLMIATGEGTARRRTIALGIAMLGCLGVASSVSRGPILAVMLMFLAGFACRTASRKWAIGGLALLAAGWITFDWSQAHEWIKRSSGNVNRRTISIQLEGETLQNDSTNYRWLIVKAYWPALSRAGLLGYGTAAVSTFPPRIPNLPESARARRMLRSVDNAYLLIGLRFGWLGMLALASLLLVSIWTCSRLFGNPAFRDLSGWLMAMLSAVAPVLLIEWLSYDFGFALLWSCGAVGGLAALAQGDMFMLDRSIHSGRNSSGRGRIEAR